MRKKSDLTKKEKKIIIQELEKSSSTLEIAKKIEKGSSHYKEILQGWY